MNQEHAFCLAAEKLLGIAVPRRAQLIRVLYCEIGRILSRENGKPLSNGVGETIRAAQIFKFFAQEALRIEGTQLPSVRPNVDVTITREPVGVVGLSCPWNVPIAIPAWKMAPALD